MSTLPSSVNRAALMHEVSAALRRGDETAAERLLASGEQAPAMLVAAGDMAMRDRRWGDAAWLLERIPKRDVPTEIKRCLCRNLSAMQIHRTNIYDLLIALPRNDNCSIGTSATGHPTIVCRRADGQNIALSPGNQPLLGLSNAMAQLKPAFESGHALALCGIGDGYLLHQVAQKPPKLFMDAQQNVFVLEPDAHVALTALMIHDYTGPTGPIEQKRFHWFIGKAWANEFRMTLETDLFLPAPHISLMLGLTANDIQSVVTAFIREQAARDVQTTQAVSDYYDKLAPAEIAAVLGENPPRRPRVLLITTRFSTVLQYSTRDTAVGFQQAGWETRILIEPTPYHRVLNFATRAALAEFKPDLIFQIDHQRQEAPNLYPPNLPFCSWFQDHMLHLKSKEVGGRIGPTDFVLSDAGPHYVHSYSYPARQMISVAKLTAAPPLLPRPASRGDDVIFVSNASGNAQTQLGKLLDASVGSDVNPRFLTACVDRMAALYAAGDSLPTYPDLCAFTREVMHEFGQELDDAHFLKVTAYLNHPIGDALYRQQALRWAASAAKSMGLTLGLYGNGWDRHPEFSEYARGPVSPGRALQDLTRKAAINLQIVPYLCLHQRLLDGICSGAFFLIRGHVSESAPPAMLDLLETNCGPDVRTLEQARTRMPPPVRDRFESLVKDCIRSLCSTPDDDPIEMVRAWREADLLVSGAAVLPHLAEVSFDDPASLRERLERFARDPDLRDQIVARQRDNMIGRLTYAAAMTKVTRKIGQLMAGQAPQTFAATPINFDFGRAA